MRLIKANRFERLSDVAYDLSYVDQSHFIKDIKAFSGYTPTGLVQTVQAGISCAVILARTHEGSKDSVIDDPQQLGARTASKRRSSAAPPRSAP